MPRSVLKLACLVLLYPTVTSAFSVQTLALSRTSVNPTATKTVGAMMRCRAPAISMAQKQNDDQEQEEWKAPGVFSPENAGPWLTRHRLLPGSVPREQVPEPLASLIPVVLGQQYGGP